MPPRNELIHGGQIEAWLKAWGEQLHRNGSLTLIGSGALLWHAYQRGIDRPLPEGSMDVDPVTDDDEVAALGYQAVMGSDFEKEHGWHVNLMPLSVLGEMPGNWKERVSEKAYGFLKAVVPSPEDLLVPKLRRNEPRDRKHAQWAMENGLVAALGEIENQAKRKSS